MSRFFLYISENLIDISMAVIIVMGLGIGLTFDATTSSELSKRQTANEVKQESVVNDTIRGLKTIEEVTNEVILNANGSFFVVVKDQIFGEDVINYSQDYIKNKVKLAAGLNSNNLPNRMRGYTINADNVVRNSDGKINITSTLNKQNANYYSSYPVVGYIFMPEVE